MRSPDRRFPFRVAGVGLLAAAVGWAWTKLADDLYGPSLLLAGVALVVASAWYRFRSTGSNAMISRWNRKNRRNAGTRAGAH